MKRYLFSPRFAEILATIIFFSGATACGAFIMGFLFPIDIAFLTLVGIIAAPIFFTSIFIAMGIWLLRPA